MNAHMTEPRLLMEFVDSGCLFPHAFVGLGKWFRRLRA
jgi:hypothetical protein